MSINRAIITAAESQVILSNEAEWLALTDTVQEYHISRASVYIQTRWTCDEIDYDDDTTITDEVKEACAYYALADLNGTLLDSSVSDDTVGKVIEESKKVGSLTKTIKWADNNEQKHYLSYPDMLMEIGCSSANSGCCVAAVRT